VTLARDNVEASSPARSDSTARIARDPRDRAIAVVVVGIALVPVLVVVALHSGRDYLPVGDIGTIDLQVRDVWSAHPPLLGPYSRYGWSHPGPLFTYLLAVPSALAGQAPWATLVGGALLQGLAVAWLGIVSWRRGGLVLTVVSMAAVGLTYSAFGNWILIEPWNPHVLVPFFGVFVLEAWCAATRRGSALVGMTVAGTLLVQTHVGYLALVGAAVAVVAACIIVDHRRSRAAPELARSLVVSAVIAAVLWIPALIDQVVNSPGNLRLLARYFVRGNASEPATGVGNAVELLAVEFRGIPAWLGGSDEITRTTSVRAGSLIVLVLVVCALAGAAGVAARRRQYDTVRYIALATAMLAAAVFAIARITGVPYPYLFLWRPALAVLIVLGVGWGLVGTMPSTPRRRLLVVVVGFTIVAWTSGTRAVDAIQRRDDVSTNERATRSLLDQLEQTPMPRRGVILRLDQRSLRALQRGVFDSLVRDGKPVFADDDIAYQVGEHRGAAAEDVDAVWWVAESGVTLATLASLPGAETIASFSPLDEQEEREANELQRRLARALREAGRTDLLAYVESPLVAFATADVPTLPREEMERLAALNIAVDVAGTFRAGVVAFPPELAPMTVPVE
jgi:hypothetical protein